MRHFLFVLHQTAEFRFEKILERNLTQICQGIQMPANEVHIFLNIRAPFLVLEYTTHGHSIKSFGGNDDLICSSRCLELIRLLLLMT